MIIDLILAILLCLAIFKGLRKGLIVALFSLIAFIVGIAAALKLSAFAANMLAEQTSVSGRWLPFVSFIVVFVIVVIVVNLVGKIVQRSVETIMLGWANRLGGAVLYILIYSFLFSVFIFYAVQLNLLKPETTNASLTYPILQPLGPKVIDGFGKIIPVFKDLFIQLQHFFAEFSASTG